MQIHDLTSEQFEMLDYLWSLETLEEVEHFKRELPRFRRQQVDTLIELVRLQVIDDSLSDQPCDTFDTVDDLLESIRKTT